MNDNRKSVLEQALDAVRSAYDTDDLSDREFRELLSEFRAKLAARDAVTGTKSH
jgi:hypothetical protein